MTTSTDCSGRGSTTPGSRPSPDRGPAAKADGTDQASVEREVGDAQSGPPTRALPPSDPRSESSTSDGSTSRPTPVALSTASSRAQPRGPDAGQTSTPTGVRHTATTVTSSCQAQLTNGARPLGTCTEGRPWGPSHRGHRCSTTTSVGSHPATSATTRRTYQRHATNRSRSTVERNASDRRSSPSLRNPAPPGCTGTSQRTTGSRRPSRPTSVTGRTVPTSARPHGCTGEVGWP